ncbi:hypothetical protein BESB_007050 [Besnoitia besnoiti]|uniref:Uncharacterized protein n=1 Tax=Besnoitia besnoiti TaxID=94643 RepID=A0A2A9MM44_BESBE|nr:hypothetical protein BESB_007050 [Besnoitia besnoiti]PFH38364.1 hypothetical protein BESB_007050 [Besnoitia besnoiti]
MRCTQGSNSDTAKHAEAPPHAGLEAEREESKIMCAYRKRKPKAGPWRLRRAARAGDPSSARSDAADDRRAEDLHSIPESAVAPGDEREALGSEVARHGMHIAEDSKAARAQRRPWPRPRGGSRRELAVLALAGGRSERLTRQRRTDTGEASGAAAETPASLDAADTSTEVGSGEREASAPRQDSEPEGVAADRETTPAAHASDRGGQDGVPTSQEEERKEEAIGRRSSRKRGRRFQVADTEDEESVSETSSRVNRELASGSEEKVQAAAAPGAEIERTRYSYDAASATGDTEAEVKLHTTEAEEVTQSDEFASATVGCAPEETTKPTLQATEAPKREGIQHESKGVPKTKSTKLRHPATAAPSLDASSGHGRRKERHLEAREDVLEKEGGGGGATESIRSPGMCLRSSEEKAQDQQANAAGESLTVAAAERTRDAKEEAADGDARGDCQTCSRTAAKNKPSSPLQPPDFSPSSVALEAPRADGLSLVFLPGLPSSPVEAGSDPARSSKRQQACETRSLEVASGDNRDASAFTPVAMLNTSSRLASVAATGLAPAGDQSCEASHLGSSAPPSETVLSLALGKVRAAEREREDKGDDREAKSAKKDEADSPVNEREAAAPGGDAPVDGRLQDGCRREARGTAQDYTEMMTQRAGEAGDDTRRNMASASAAASSDAPEGEPDRRQGRQQTDRTQETHARERDEAREGEAGGSRIETLAYCCLGSPPPLQPLLSQRLWSVSAFLQRRGDKSEGRDKVKQNALPSAPRALTATPLSCLTQRLYTRLPSAAEARGRSRASPPSARKGEPSSDSSGEREGTKETTASPEEKGGARQATAESRESKCVEFEGAKDCIEESHFAGGRGGRYDRQERGYKEKAVTEEREVFDGNKDRTGHDPDNRHSSLTRSPYEGAAADSRNRSLPPRRTSVDSRHAFPRRHRALGRRDLFREEERRPRRAWSSRSESSSRSASTQPPGRREYFDRGSSSSPDARRHRSRDRSRELRGSRETSSDRSPKHERHSAEGGSVWGEERGSSSASRRRGCGGREPVGRPSTERHTHPEHRRERRKTDAERDRSRGSSQPFRRRSHHETQFCRRRDDTQREAWAHSRDASEKDSPSRTGRGQRSRSRDGASHRRRRGSYRERRCDDRESDAGQRDSGGGTARTGARSRGRPFAEDIQFSPETRSLQNDARMPATKRASERGASERHRDRNLTRPLVWLGSRKHSRERSPESRRGAYSHSPVHRHSGGRVQVRGHPSSRQRQARPERWSEECEECDERGAPRSEVLPCESMATRRRSSHDSLGAGRTCVGEATANADSEPEPTRSRGHSRYSKRKGESLGSTGEGRGRRSARERSDVRGWILGATCPDPEQTLHSRAPERLEGNRGDSDPHSRPQDGRAAARSSHPPARDIFTAFQIKGTPLAKARRPWEAGEMPKIKVSLLTRKPQAAPNRDDAVQP